MNINKYLYALCASLLLTYMVSQFYNVTNNILQGILLTLFYIFIIHFVQDDKCFIKGVLNLPDKLVPKQNNTTPKSDESFNMGGYDSEYTNDIVSSPVLNSRVHANDLYNDNVLNENRLNTSHKNNLYYALSNQHYPMNNRNQINQKDCTNDGTCLIPEDEHNLHPVRQSLKEVLPVPNIGPQEITLMNKLNPKLSANYKYPVPIESIQTCKSTPLDNFYQLQSDNKNTQNNQNNNCDKCSISENTYNIQNNTSNDVPETKEMFGLFDTYHMIDHDDPIYINSPLISSQQCKNCVTGHCQGDLCSSNPHKKFERNDPLNM